MSICDNESLSEYSFDVDKRNKMVGWTPHALLTCCSWLKLTEATGDTDTATAADDEAGGAVLALVLLSQVDGHNLDRPDTGNVNIGRDISYTLQATIIQTQSSFNDSIPSNHLQLATTSRHTTTHLPSPSFSVIVGYHLSYYLYYLSAWIYILLKYSIHESF